MASLLDVIKQAGHSAVQAGNPVTVFYGIVTKADPLEVNVDQRFTLTADFLVIADQLTEYKITVGVTEYTIRQGLQLGDKLILLRVQGGQTYVILDRVVSG